MRLITLASKTLKYIGVTLSNPHGAWIGEGVTAVVGANGAGKTTLANILESGWNFIDNEIRSCTDSKPRVRRIAFTDIHSLANFATEYYQQRYESMMNDDVPTVAALLGEKLHEKEWVELTTRLGLTNAAAKKVNFLSSGELRKLLIANTLLEHPDVLILDNPYIGLDATSRTVLDGAIEDIARRGTAVVMLVCDPADVPPYVNTVLPMRSLTIEKPIEKTAGEDIDELRRTLQPLFPKRIDTAAIDRTIKLHGRKYPADGSSIIEMHHCKVKYGAYTLISDVNWTVLAGECWALTGRNGSGKSTLLSLVNADNPQGYANDIRLFGRRRGTGESIWDIKDRIGHLSSELHLYFNTRLDTLRQVVAGGLSSFARATSANRDADTAAIDSWIEALDLAELSDRRFNTLSAGQQRLGLFARAVVKSPQLLILDEPMHGVDTDVKNAIRHTVEALAESGTTIIYVTHRPDELPGCVTHTKRLGEEQKQGPSLHLLGD